jgi:hypothetical protein
VLVEEEFIAYLEGRREHYISTIRLFEEGRIGTSQRTDGELRDTTQESLARCRDNLTEVEAILAKIRS